MMLYRCCQGIVLMFVFLFLLAVGYSAEIVVTTPDSRTVVETDAALTMSEGGRVCFEGDSLRYLGQPGEPEIPWRVLTVLVPSDTDLSALSISTEAIFEPCDVMGCVVPMPPMATRDEDGNEIVFWPLDKEIVDGCDRSIYESDAFWPSADACLLSTGSLRGWKMAEVAVPLFRYNPVSGMVEQLTSAIVSLTESMASADRVCSAMPSTGAVRSIDLAGLRRVRKLAVNYTEGSSSYVSLSVSSLSTVSGTGYAIITTNSIVQASDVLSRFVSHKESQGFSVRVVTEDDFGEGAGDTASSNIRSWLQGHYGNFEYALFIGDPTTTSTVPMKKCLIDHPTDYFYAELTADWDADGDGIYGEKGDDASNGDEIEKYFELYVGRIPYYGNIADLDDILQKTIDYETSTDTAWRSNALLAMYRLDDNTPSYQLGESIKTHLDAKGYNYDRVYQDYYGVYSYPEYLFDDVYPGTLWSRNDYGLVVWCTHGSSTGASQIMSTSHVAGLDNNHPSATYQASCQNGYPERSYNLGYSILKNGGITTCCASRNGVYYIGHNEYTESSTQGGIGYEYARRLLVNDDSCGKALWDTKEYLDLWLENYYVMNLYGDPSVVIAVEPNRLLEVPSSVTNLFKTYDSATSIGTEELTLTNYTASSVAWTAVSDANWLDLSVTEGVLNASQSIPLTLSLNEDAELLLPGTYETEVVITSLSNSTIEVHQVMLEVFAKQLVCYLEMEETGGTKASDSSMNNLDIQLRSDDSFDFSNSSVAGVYGQALSFDGTDDYVLIPGSLPRLNLYTNSITLTCWIKRTVNQDEGAGIIFARDDGTIAGLRFGENNKIGYCWGGENQVTTSLLVPANTWTFIALVIEPDSAMVYRYYNSRFRVARYVNTHETEGFGGRIMLGKDTELWYSHKYFEGAMDDIRIYNYALSATDIQQLVQSNSSPEFSEDITNPMSAKEGVSFSGTLSDWVADGNGDEMYYCKNSGPEWLAVSSDGSFTGMAYDEDTGTNTFVIRAQDYLGDYCDAIWTIDVANRCMGDNGISDLHCLANRWLESGCTDCIAEDLNEDSNVDLDDFLILAGNWLSE